MLDCLKSELHAKERCVSVGRNKGNSDVRCMFTEGNDLFTMAAFQKETKGMCVYCREFQSPV